MKTKLLTLLLLASMLLATRVVAQSVFNTNDSHVWYEHFDNNNPIYGPHTYVHYFTLPTNADTTINTTSYKKFYCETYTSSNSNYTKDSAKLVYCIRYDTIQNNVYVMFNDSVNEHLFYKFNIQVGDTIYNLLRYDNNNFFTATFKVKMPPNISCNNIVLEDILQNYPAILWFKNIGSEILNEFLPGPLGTNISNLICHTDSTQPCYAANCNINLLVGKKTLKSSLNASIRTNPVQNNCEITNLNYKHYNYALVNTMGISVITGSINASNKLTLTTTLLPNGLYTLLLQEQTTNTAQTLKVLIQN